ncbi:hypothetical protein ACJMK2_002764 [Sinanodonta woodiana]|uniref:Uncharacterized protein n=1 Tax=Sinanodonta woodiana TaxID=1069815 RepID=A0ABD3XZG1_SINWO
MLFVRMRNLSIFLLLLACCAVVLSSGVRERRSYLDENGDKAELELLQQAIDEGKVDINNLMAERENNPSRRFWFRYRLPWILKK